MDYISNDGFTIDGLDQGENNTLLTSWWRRCKLKGKTFLMLTTWNREEIQTYFI